MKDDLRAYRTFQALILGGLGIFLFARIGDGRILLYINQRFLFLILAAAVAFLLLAQALMRARPGLHESSDNPASPGPSAEGSHSGGSAALWLLALPLLVGLLVPQRALGASAAAMRGIRAGIPLTASSTDARLALAVPERERSILDWVQVFELGDAASLVGQVVDVTGFVYHDLREADGYFLTARFSVTCCVADASALGMAVAWPQAEALSDNSWVRVRGKIALREVDGRRQPYIQAEAVTAIQAPEQPYLFP